MIKSKTVENHKIHKNGKWQKTVGMSILIYILVVRSLSPRKFTKFISYKVNFSV